MILSFFLSFYSCVGWFIHVELTCATPKRMNRFLSRYHPVRTFHRFMSAVLDACTQLYKSLCPSVCLSFGQLVGRSITFYFFHDFTGSSTWVVGFYQAFSQRYKKQWIWKYKNFKEHRLTFSVSKFWNCRLSDLRLWSKITLSGCMKNRNKIVCLSFYYTILVTNRLVTNDIDIGYACD